MVELSENDKWNMLSREDQQLSNRAQLALQANENRCAFTEHEHVLEVFDMCPVTGNPLCGSTITINYRGSTGFLEVASLRAFVDSYAGGKGDVRSMEGMLQEIAQAAADILRVDVKLSSYLRITPAQTMKITCYAFANKGLEDIQPGC